MRLKARVTCLFSGSDASIASETSWFVTSKYLYSRIDLWRLGFYVDIVPVAALCNFLHFPVPISHHSHAQSSSIFKPFARSFKQCLMSSEADSDLKGSSQ
jgi:hypothetical protein